MDIVQYFHALQSVRMLRMYSHKLRFLRFAENLNTFYPLEHSLHIACWVNFTLGSQGWAVQHAPYNYTRPMNPCTGSDHATIGAIGVQIINILKKKTLVKV